jgi:phage gpG-like protein
VTPGELADEFGRAADRAGDLGVVLNAFVSVMNASIQKNVDGEGRPTPWEPTRFPLPGHKATLHNTGALRASARAVVEGNDVVLTAGGSGQPRGKAPALHYGAQLHNKRRVQTGRFVRRRAWKDTYRYGGLLPPRPYLLFHPDDLAYLGDEMPSFIFKTVKF